MVMSGGVRVWSKETGLGPVGVTLHKRIEDFRIFMLIDLQLSTSTVKGHIRETKKFLAFLGKKPLCRETIREYLMLYKSKNSYVYKNVLSSIKRFVRDYLELEQMVSTFKFPKHIYRPKIIPTKEKIRKFYESLDSLKEKALFLMYASTGLRNKELLSLTFNDVDFNSKTITPRKNNQTTKKVWCTFYNEEAEKVLVKYLESRKDNNEKLFPFDHNKFDELWRKGKERTEIHITPQVLREFFCQQMGELGVPDRYIDAFCGRVPKSILARHYTDYSPERLKRIYDKAKLRVLS